MRSTVPAFFDTDKIEPHGYFQTYVQLAGQLGPATRVLELGVENGESLKMWQALFPLGDITGVDLIDSKAWPAGTHKIICSQDDPELPGKLGGTFGLIIDDCSHHGIATRKSFELLWPLVKPGGYYVVEDWTVALRDDPHWGMQKNWGNSMLKTVEGFLPLLSYRDGECDEIIYRYGLVIIHRSAAND